MIDINVRGGKLGHGTEDKAAANEGDLDLHWVLAGTEAAKRSGLFIGHNNIVSVSVGALVFVKCGFGGGIYGYQLHFSAADTASD